MRSLPDRQTGAPANPGLVVLIGTDPDNPGDLAWPAVAALSAADAVLHIGDIDPATLALVPRRCSVESLPAVADRARKLAGEGWRVVWLVAGDPEDSTAKSADAERLAEAGITVRAIAGLPSRAGSTGTLIHTPVPQPLATALNGLAG